MCGILGVIDLTQSIDIELNKFQSALMKMIHRGPDNQSVVQVNEHCLLGHVRLSIIDLEAHSNQPFVDPAERYYLVYNGEIFNYVELREELKSLGCTFRTESDTEVLLQSYITWGEDCVQRFNGMWAFVIYDAVNNSVFCSRDRFGVKPFYYAIIGSIFVFASEIKPIISLFPDLRQPNLAFIGEYIRKSVGAQYEETWFNNVKRLNPASTVQISKESIEFNKYWDYPTAKVDCSEVGITEAYKDLFLDAVNIRHRSDVPVSIALSAGVDSNSILFCTDTQKGHSLKTFSIGVDLKNYNNKENEWLGGEGEIKDEAQIAESMSNLKNIAFKRVTVNNREYVKTLTRIMFFLESGNSSPAVMPYNQLMKEVSNNHKVILEGQGADELLGGYIIPFGLDYCIELISNLKFGKAINLFKSISKTYSIWYSIKVLVSANNIRFLRTFYELFTGSNKLIKSKLKGKRFDILGSSKKINEVFLNYRLRVSHRNGLVNLLHYGDAISMSHSVESRLPFMDYRLVEFVFKLPSKFKIRDGMGKVLHRDAMKGIVPDVILEDRLKMGFNTPLLNIFLQTGTDSPRAVLLSERCLNRGLFDGKALEKALDRLSKDASLLPMIYRMLTVELWFRLFIDGDEIEGLKVL